MASAALVPLLDFYVYKHALSPSHVKHVREITEKVARLEAGESVEDVFGPPSLPIEEWLQRFYDEHPGEPRRYRLPSHLHWTGAAARNGGHEAR